MLLTRILSRNFNRDAIRVNDYRTHDAESVLNFLEYKMSTDNLTAATHNKLIPMEKTMSPLHYLKLKKKAQGVSYYQMGLLYQRVKFLSSVMIEPKQKWSEIRRYQTPFIIAFDSETTLNRLDYVRAPLYFLKGLIMDESNIESNANPKMYFFHQLYDLLDFPPENLQKQLNFICDELKVDSCTVLRYIHRMPTYLTYINTKDSPNVGITSLPLVPYNMEIQKLKCGLFPPRMKPTIDTRCFKVDPMYHRMILNNFDGVSSRLTTTTTTTSQHLNVPFQDILDTNYAKHYTTYTPDDLFNTLYRLCRHKQGQRVLDWKVRKRIRSLRLESRHVRDEIMIRQNRFERQLERAARFAIDNYICCPKADANSNINKST